MNPYMKRAVELAANNVREGGDPFGAVLVKDGEVIAEAVNTLHKTFDISGHAELLTIRAAQQEYKTLDLSGFTMYASGIPCPMCLTAMYFSGITDVYYCQSLDDASAVGLDRSEVIYADLAKPNEERIVAMKHMPLEKGQENPMKMWKEANENG